MKNQKGFTLVEIMIVVVIIGLLAVMAIPAFQKVRATSQKNVIVNNLRQLSNAADQYFLAEGKTQAAYSDLVGTGKYITTLNPVAGEVYTDVTINQGETQVSLTVTALGADPVVYNH